MELFAQRFADAFDAGELVGGGEVDDVAIEAADGLRALAVGADFERVLVLEFKQQGDFVKDVGKRFSGHGRGERRACQGGWKGESGRVGVPQPSGNAKPQLGEAAGFYAELGLSVPGGAGPGGRFD